jgi:hypothetical protein
MKLEESEALAAAAFAGAGTRARVREVVADLPASRSSTPRKELGQTNGGERKMAQWQQLNRGNLVAENEIQNRGGSPTKNEVGI